MSGLIFNYIIRNLAKYTYKFLYPKSYKHNRRYWPFYQVNRNESGHIKQVFFRNQLIVDHERTPVIQNRKCMLVATGPSTQHLDAKHYQRPDIDYMGVNGAITLPNIQFKYYVIIDHDFIRNRFDLVTKVLQMQCIFFTTARCLDEILKKMHLADIRCDFKVIEIISAGKNEKFMGDTITGHEHQEHYFFHENFGFSLNFQDAIFDYYTVAYTAFQIIYGLGYEEIFLIGIDLTDLNQARFYESEQHKQPTLIHHHLDDILKAFACAARVFNQKNKKVYNLSHISIIPHFPKVSITHAVE